MVFEFVSGPLFTGGQALPLCLDTWLCDLRSRFLAKGQVGQHFRAIARNGRVLLAADRPLAELCDQPVRMRLQIWHRRILPGDRAEPYGILLCVRNELRLPGLPAYRAQLVQDLGPCCALAVEVGGGRTLEFQRIANGQSEPPG